MSSPRSTSGGWLFGPGTDLLLGCGGVYFAIFVLFTLGGSGLRDAQGAWLVAVITLVVSAPHYGGTLLRVYEQRADRRAYALFSLWATLGVALLFVLMSISPARIARAVNEMQKRPHKDRSDKEIDSS